MLQQRKRMQTLQIIEFVGYLINREPTRRAYQSVVETALVFTSKRSTAHGLD